MKRLYKLYILIFFLTSISLTSVAQVLSTTGVPTNLCARESFRIGFEFAGGVSSGNVYIAELSNASGSFASPIQIGSIASLSLSGTIDCNIPAGIAFGTGYQIRVLATATTFGQVVQPSSNIDISCTTRDYYWVGSTGNWSDLSHWEYTTDGVTFIAATEIPTANDNVTIDDSTFPSGGKLTVDVIANCNNFYWYPISASKNPTIYADYTADFNVRGDFVLAPGVNREIHDLFFRSSKHNIYLDFGDNRIDEDPSAWWKGYVDFYSGGSWEIGSDLVAENIGIYDASIVNTNDYLINLKRELYLGYGEFYAGQSDIYTSGLNIYSDFIADLSTIYLQTNENGQDPYINGSNTYNNVVISDKIANVNQDNTYSSLSLVNGGGMNIQSSTHQVVNNSFIVQGTRGDMVVIKSNSVGVQHTFNIGSGATVAVDYANITDSEILGNSSPYSVPNGINGGNNIGWNITQLVPTSFYWVGGPGDWSDPGHWAASDGGVPTADGPAGIDNVYFTSSSFPASGRVTVDKDIEVNNVTWEPGSGSTFPEFYGEGNNFLTVYGDFTLDNGVRRNVYRLSFNSSKNGQQTINFADNYQGWGDVFFEGGGIADLASDINNIATIFLRDGTFNTNNYRVDAGSLVSESDLSVANFGSSELTFYWGFYKWAMSSSINAGSSILYLGRNENDNPEVNGNSIINFNAVVVAANNTTIHNSNTYNSLTVNPGRTLKLEPGSIQTINNGGNLNLVGTRSSFANVRSNSDGALATFVVSGANIAAEYLSIQDNTIDNGVPGNNVVASNSVDNGNNVGWTINPIMPLDFYWVNGPGKWSEPSHWATSDGGSTLHTFSPGNVDNVFFTPNSFPAGGQLDVDTEVHFNNMTWTAGSGSSFPRIYADYQNRVYVHGSLQLADGVNRDIQYLIFDSDNPGNTVDLADNITNWGDIDFQGSGEWTLMSELTAAYLNIRGGTFNTNNNTINLFQQLYIDTAPLTMNMGSSEVNLFRLYNNADGINSIFNADNSVFNFAEPNNEGVLEGNYPLTFNNVVIKGDMVFQNQGFTFNNLTLEPGISLELGDNLIQTISGTFTALGERSQMNEISSTNAGSQATLLINTGGGSALNVEYLLLEDIYLDNGSGGSTLEIAANSVDNGNNFGWDFITTPLTPLNYYWVGGTGKWSETNHWATSDGGSTLHSFPPGLVDNVNFTSASFPSGGEITLDQPASCNNMSWNDGSFNPSIRGSYENRLTIAGNLTIANGVNRNLEYIEFNSNTNNQLTFGDNKFEYSVIRFEGTGTWNLIDGLEANTLNLVSGTLNTNNQSITLHDEFIMEDSDDAINLNFGSSIITTRYLYNWRYSGNVNADIGTSEVVILDNGQLNGQPMELYDLTFEGSGRLYSTMVISNTLTVNPGGELSIRPSNPLTVENLVASGTRPLPVTINSTQNGQAATISKASGTVDLSHVILKDNNATGGATFNATDAYDRGNVSGWNITEIIGQNYYWVANNGDWSDRNSWSLSDGTSVVPATAPGPADDVLVTPNSSMNAAGLMNLDIPAECHNMIWTTGNGGNIAGDYENPLTLSGSFILSSGVQYNLQRLVFNSSETGLEINTAGNSTNQGINMEFWGSGEWTLLDSLYTSYLSVFGGTIITNDQPLTARYIDINNYEGTPLLNLTNSNVYTHYIYGTNSFLINAAGSTVYLNYDNRDTQVYYAWNFNNVVVDGTVWFRYGSSNFNNLTILPGSEVQFQANESFLMNQLSAVGLRSRPITIKSTTVGSQATILQSSGVVAGQYLVLQDNSALGGASFAANNSIDNGNINGWNVVPISPRNYFWVGGSGKWSEYSAHWANTDGGSNFFDSSPGPLDNVNFTSNSFPSGGTLTLDYPTFVDNMTWSGITSNVSITDNDEIQNSLSVNGSLALANGVSRDFYYLNLTSSDQGETLDFADNLQSRNYVFFEGTGEWILNSPIEAYYLLFNGGTFRTNNHNVKSSFMRFQEGTTTYWGSSNAETFRFYNYASSPSAFNSETSVFTFYSTTYNLINGNPARFFLTVFEGPTTIRSENIFYNASLNMGELQLDYNQAFNSLSMASGTSLLLGPNTTQTVSAVLDLNGTVDAPVIVNSVEEGTAGIFSMPGNSTVNASYVHLKDNTALGGADFTATNSSDFGNVTGWNGLLTGQTIDFGSLSDRTLTAGSFTVDATASSTLPVTFEIASGSATSAGNTITPSGTGLIGVRASQAGNGTFGSAKPALRYIHIDATTEPNELGNMKESKLVIGQPNSFSNDYYYSDVTTPNPWSTAVSSTGKLAIANGARVLIWNQIPDNYNIPADVVIGQNDFTSEVSSATATTYYGGVTSVSFTHDDKLLVTDGRGVLIYNSIPTTNGAAADIIIGQSVFTETKSGTGPDRFNSSIVNATTYFNSVDGSEKLFVSDYTNNRVLIFNSIPTVNGASADVVIGQQDFDSQYSGTGPDELNSVLGCTVSPDGKLIIADFNNSRVLIFNSIPTSNGASADIVLGQPDFGFADPGTSYTNFNRPIAVDVSRDGKLAVADYSNHRVLIYNSVPTNSNTNPDFILGQPDETSAAANYNGLISGRSMSLPIDISWDFSKNLYISDTGNDRVLLFGAADLEAPVLSNPNLPSSHDVGSGTPGSFTLTDRSGTFAEVQYRGISSSDMNFASLPVTDDGSGNFSFNTSDIYPGGEPLGIEYRIAYSDGVGNGTLGSTETMRLLHNGGLSITNFGVGSTSEDYRLFSVPLDLNSKDVKTVFDEIITGSYDNTKLRVFSYPGGTSGNYTELSGSSSNIELGKGYIALASTSATVSSGTGLTADVSATAPYETSLVPGWNMIGNPYNFNVSWSDILSESAISGTQPATPQGFTGQWGDVTLINKGTGVFVNNPTTSNMVIKFPVVKGTGGRIAGNEKLTNSLLEDNWEVRILETSIEGNELLLGAIGMDENAELSYDDLDRINPPAFSEQARIEFPHPEFFQPSFKKDIRPNNYEEKWQFNYTASTNDVERAIYWDNSYFGENTPDIYLVDKSHLKVINMKEESSYAFLHGGTTEFEIYFGMDAYDQLRPDNLVTITPYPNPFTDQISINVGLPADYKDGKVIVAIFNTLGKQVATINTFIAGEAYMEFIWQGDNDSGQEVPDGVYAYRVLIDGSYSEYVSGKIVKE